MSTGTVIQPTAFSPENIFELSVKEGNYVNKYNFLSPDLQSAIDKGRRYCENSGGKRRFIHVRPFILDLDKKVHDEKAS